MSFLLLTFLLLGLFCFWAPTNDDHATSAFYLLTQHRKCHADSKITKLQFLNIIAISEKQQNIKRLLFFLFVTSPKKVLQITNGLQVNDYEIVVKFFHISHNLT